MTQSSNDLPALLCSKLCHDLLSPVGAITNGLELLADETDPEMRERCFELLNDSARTSANKLKYFRLAFGAAGGYGDRVDPAEAQQLVQSLADDNGRIELNWVVNPDMMPKAAVKVLLNLALVAKESLVRGGQLDIGAEQGDRGMEVVVRAAADKVVLDSGIRQALEGSLPEAELSSRTAAAWMTRQLVMDGGGDLRISPPADGELLLGAIVADG